MDNKYSRKSAQKAVVAPVFIPGTISFRVSTYTIALPEPN
jgi:hypothetical protein